MGLLKKRETETDEQFRIRIRRSIVEEAKAYAAWAEIQTLSLFFEEAAVFILEKDREWKNFKKHQPNWEQHHHAVEKS